MATTTPFASEGPYMLVMIKDAVAPDWDALRRDIMDQTHQAPRVALVVGPTSGISAEDPGLRHLVDRLRGSGVEAAIVA